MLEYVASAIRFHIARIVFADGILNLRTIPIHHSIGLFGWLVLIKQLILAEAGQSADQRNTIVEIGTISVRFCDLMCVQFRKECHLFKLCLIVLDHYGAVNTGWIFKVLVQELPLQHYSCIDEVDKGDETNENRGVEQSILPCFHSDLRVFPNYIGWFKGTLNLRIDAK